MDKHKLNYAYITGLTLYEAYYVFIYLNSVKTRLTLYEAY